MSQKSAAFQRYLNAQTPARARELLGLEARYLAARQHAKTARDAAERDYEESMHGYRDDNEGVAVKPFNP